MRIARTKMGMCGAGRLGSKVGKVRQVGTYNTYFTYNTYLTHSSSFAMILR